MTCMGIAIKKNEIWFSVVDGTSMGNSVILDSGKQLFQADESTPSLMMKFSNIFTELITKYTPDSIAYKLSLNIDMKQVRYMHYSLGILNWICKNNGLTVKERSSNWITAGKRAKINDCLQYFSDTKFRSNEEMQATLIAWFETGK